MLKFPHGFVAASAAGCMLLLILSGCSEPKNQPTANNNSPPVNNTPPAPPQPGGAGGAAAPPVSAQDEEPPAEEPASGGSAAVPPPPTGSIGGGGATLTVPPRMSARERARAEASGNNQTTNRLAAGSGAGAGSLGGNAANSEESFAGGGLVNGFFPQPKGDDSSFAAEGALANGFYPQSASGSGGGVPTGSVTAEIPPYLKLLDQAAAAFKARDEADAFKYLYGYLLSSQSGLAKYPIKWYPELSQPRVALRWGVGVIYSNRNEDDSPLVIGHPTGVREREGGRSGRSGRGGLGAGGSGSLGSLSEGNEGNAASGADSDYGSVNTEHPEGFLLYYTGDFGDRLLTRLESRRQHPEAFYGDILKDLNVDYSDETTSAPAQAQSNTSRNTRRRGGGGLTIGGGGGGGNIAPPNLNPGGGGGGVGGGGGNAAASTSDRLRRVSTGSVAAPPVSSMTGTLAPGVMLVGEGSREQLIERAKKLGLDGLLLFKANVSSGSRQVGMFNLKVINLHAGEGEEEEVFNSRNLKTDSVAEAREELDDPSKDPIEVALDDVFQDVVDVRFKAAPLPDVLREKPEYVENRINSVLDSNPEDPMLAAIEIMSFHQQGMLSDDFAKQALSRLLGGTAGETMIGGTDEERYNLIKKYLPSSSDNSSQDEFR